MPFADFDCCRNSKQAVMRPINSLWRAVKKIPAAAQAMSTAEGRELNVDRIKRWILFPVFGVVWVRGLKAWWTRHRPRTRRVSAGDDALSPRFEAGGKLVSVLLPSRGRPQGLLHAVSSLIARCDNPACIEILIRLDDDDDSGAHDTARHLRSVFGETTDIQVMTGPRGNGYASLHEFVEEMCAVARGDFLLLLNDDLTMDTEGWDAELGRFRNELCVLRLRSPVPRHCSHLTAFPAVHRKLHQIIGHFSLNGLCDAWIQGISRGAGIERRCRVRVTHKQKYDYDDMDSTASEVISTYAPLENQLKSSEQEKLRNADLAKVKAYLDRHGVQLQRIEAAG